jgi:uncharacterized membrane protein SirB2
MNILLLPLAITLAITFAITYWLATKFTILLLYFLLGDDDGD